MTRLNFTDIEKMIEKETRQDVKRKQHREVKRIKRNNKGKQNGKNVTRF